MKRGCFSPRNALVSLLVALVFIGCVTRREPNRPTEDTARERAAVERALADVFDAAAKKDFPRLDSHHAYGPNFTKFADDQLGRQDSETARQGEHRGLSAVADLSMVAEDLQVDVFGDAAVATFIMSYRFTAGTEAMSRKARATLVFVKHDGRWKIAHEHFSALQPGP